MTDKLSTSEQDPPQQMKSFKNGRFRNHPALEILTVFICYYLLKITFLPGHSFKQHLVLQTAFYPHTPSVSAGELQFP